MKLLVIGSGGREHALAWKLAQSPRVTALYAAPGHPGIAQAADLVQIGVMDFDKVARFSKQNNIDLVVVGPEDPLANGIVDHLAKEGIRAFGPTREAAQLEADKWFAKELMRHQAVPTAEARTFSDPSAAEEFVRARAEPVRVE